MTKQALVIGLGRLGMSMARSLAERGVDVLAVDADPKRVEDASEVVADAVAFDATDESELARAQPQERDLCVCAIGDQSHEASILCTALLRQLGAPRIVARANSLLHGRILKMVGAHEVVNPLENFGERFADKFVFERLKGELELAGGLAVGEVEPQADLVGKTLQELRLPSRLGVTVVATRRRGAAGVILPTPDQVIREKDILVVVAKRDALQKLASE